MKPKIFAAILLSIVFITSSFAINPKNLIISREIAIMAPFKNIVVGDYINVILVQDPYLLTVTVTGDEKNIHYVQASIVNNQLSISSKKNLEGKKITVLVPVADLSEIKLSSGSTLSGRGVLKFNDLTVVVSTDSHLALNTLGEITIIPADNCDFVYEKNEKYKVIPSPF